MRDEKRDVKIILNERERLVLLTIYNGDFGYGYDEDNETVTSLLKEYLIAIDIDNRSYRPTKLGATIAQEIKNAE